MINIFEDEWYWKGKPLKFTWHFKEELDALRKTPELVLYCLINGKHFLVSKNQEKYNVFHYYKNKYVCISYVEENDCITMIHIKPIRRIPSHEYLL